MQRKFVENSKAKKSWKIKSADGTTFAFTPIFQINPENKDDLKEIECTHIEIQNIDEENAPIYSFNYINLFQFIYFIANEELRQQLLQRAQRTVNYIPYDVMFTLDEEEKRKGVAKRRINLSVDEITMAVARDFGWKRFLANKLGDPNYEEWFKQMQLEHSQNNGSMKGGGR